MNKHIEQPALLLKPFTSLIFDADAIRFSLSATQSKVIARCMIKQMVFVTYQYFGKPVPEGFWDWLDMPGRPLPPEGTSIWIGHFAPDATNMNHLEKEALAPRLLMQSKWSSSLILGNLAVFLLYEHGDGHFQTAHPAEDIGYLVRLDWSRKAQTEWPPARTMNATGRDTIHSTFPIYG